MEYKILDTCLVCDSKNLQPFCDLGTQPLANNLKDKVDQPDELFPLKTNVCTDCWHSQLSVAVDREALFRHYLYVSGTTNTMVNEFDAVAKVITAENPNGKKMLDIASNDGTLMRSFMKCGWDTWGIDPAENLVGASSLRFNMICDFFPSERLRGKFDVITAFNVFAHVPNPVDFVRSCAEHLADDGTLYIQTSQKNMIKNGEFDTIYHEHHSFFSVNSMATIVHRAGLYLSDVEFRPIHGTSYLFKIKKSPQVTEKPIITEAVQKKMDEEKHLYSIDTYKEFGAKVEQNKNKLRELIANSRKTVVGYGCAAKGVVRTNYFGVHHKYIVDENPLKIGKVVGGVNIRIASPEEFMIDPEPLLIIVYAWNLYDEIVGKIRKQRPNMNDEIISANII